MPGWMGALIWKCRASSCAPARLAISPLASLGAKPCKPVLGKPTVAAVAPSRTPRLVMTGNAVNFPSALSNARSLALSTFTTFAAIGRAAVTNRTVAPSPATCWLVMK